MLELADPPTPSWMDLPPYLLESLRQNTTAWAAPAGRTIYSEGDQAVALYLVEYGEVRLFRRQPDREYTVSLVGSHGIFGEMAVLEEVFRAHNAETTRASRLRTLYKDTYFRLAREWPMLRHFVAVTLAQRLRQANQQIEVLSYAGSRGRLLHLLLQLHHKGLAQGGLAMTQQQLANQARISRESVTQVMGELRRIGAAFYKGGLLYIADPQKLEDLLLG